MKSARDTTLTPNPTSEPQLYSISGATRTINEAVRRERFERHTLLNKAFERAREASRTVLQNDDSPLEGKEIHITRRILDGAANIGGLVVSPLSYALNALGVRNASTKLCLLGRSHVSEAVDARADIVLQLAEIGVAGGAALSFGQAIPGIFAVLGSALLTAKLGGAISDIVKITRGDKPDANLAKQIALKLVQHPALAGAIDTFASIVDKADDKTSQKCTDLKLALKHGQCSREMLNILDDFYHGYEKAFPETQRERKENLIQYLANDPEFDLHVVRKDGAVIGGFTTSIVNHPVYGKHLMLEQMFPPREHDSASYAEVWNQVQEYSKAAACSGIWSEVGLTEIPPPGFSLVDAPHAQPALKGCPKGDTNLRMSVYLPEPTDKISGHLYRSIVLEGWIKTWAHNADPILKELTKRLNRGQENFNLRAPDSDVNSSIKLPEGKSALDNDIVRECSRSISIDRSRYVLIPENVQELSLHTLASRSPEAAEKIVKEIFPSFVEAFPFDSQRNTLEQMLYYLDQAHGKETDFKIILVPDPFTGKPSFAGAYVHTMVAPEHHEKAGFLLYVWNDQNWRGLGFGNLLEEQFCATMKSMGANKVLLEANDPSKMNEAERAVDETWGSSSSAREKYYRGRNWKKIDAFYEQAPIQVNNQPCSFLSVWVKSLDSKPPLLTAGEYLDYIENLLFAGEPWDNLESDGLTGAQVTFGAIKKGVLDFHDADDRLGLI